MFTFDLKSGYHHVQIIPSHYQYLGFSYVDAYGRTRYFCFTVLPFGLSTAGFIFSKILRELVKYWRDIGLLVVLFLDDGVSSAENYDLALSDSQQIKRDLLRAGWVSNKDKSHWMPVQVLSWLGFFYDLVRGLIFATDEKLTNTIAFLQSFSVHDVLSVRVVAKIVGKIISLVLSHGDIVYLRTRYLQHLIASTDCWDQSAILSVNCYDEIKFWIKYLPFGNGSIINYNPSSNSVCFSDASKTGCAAVFFYSKS